MAAAVPSGSLPVRRQPHFYVVAFWPGHEMHVSTSTYESLGSLEDATAALWPAIRAATSVGAARQLLLQHAPHEYFLRGDQILRNKTAQLVASRPLTREPAWRLKDFAVWPLPLSQGRSILLPGAAGIGKTCFAAAHGMRPFVMKTLDQCKDIPPDADLLIFDDMNFGKEGLDVTPEEMIAILDMMWQTAIKCRHYDGLIPCLARIFTTNLDCSSRQHPFPQGASAAQQEAIDRRYIQMHWHDVWMFKEPKRDSSGAASVPGPSSAPAPLW